MNKRKLNFKCANFACAIPGVPQPHQGIVPPISQDNVWLYYSGHTAMVFLTALSTLLLCLQDEEGGPAECNHVCKEYSKLQGHEPVIDERCQRPHLPALELHGRVVTLHSSECCLYGGSINHKCDVGHQHNVVDGSIGDLIHEHFLCSCG
eukprot:scaffold350_cov333-Pavlova_lutheri.AAC.9